jgi:hypothetical protein
VSADAAGTATPVQIDVTRGRPTDEELAAVMAVVPVVYAAETDAATAPEPVARSRWELSARSLRRPLDRDRGWAGFTG